MKLKSILNAIARFFVIILLPILFVKYFNEYFSYFGVSLSEYSIPIIITGFIYITFRFLEEYYENPKYKIIFGGIALGMIIFWTYYLLNKGILAVNVEGIRVTIYYYPLLIILIIFMILRYPEIFMKYYSELQKYDQKKKQQNSAQESL